MSLNIVKDGELKKVAGNAETADIKINPSEDNALKATEDGLMVDGSLNVKYSSKDNHYIQAHYLQGENSENKWNRCGWIEFDSNLTEDISRVAIRTDYENSDVGIFMVNNMVDTSGDGDWEDHSSIDICADSVTVNGKAIGEEPTSIKVEGRYTTAESTVAASGFSGQAVTKATGNGYTTSKLECNIDSGTTTAEADLSSVSSNNAVTSVSASGNNATTSLISNGNNATVNITSTGASNSNINIRAGASGSAQVGTINISGKTVKINDVDTATYATTDAVETVNVPTNNIASGADLNECLTLGIYKVSTATIAATLKNCPVKTQGFRLVVRNDYQADIVEQRIEAGLDSDYTRKYTISTKSWTSWRQNVTSVWTEGTSGQVRIHDGTNFATAIQAFNEGTTYGSELCLGASGNTFIGSGESNTTLRTALTAGIATGEQYSPTGENMFVASDGNIFFYTKCDTIGNRLGIEYDNAGAFRPLVNNTRTLGSSSIRWNNVYSTTFTENGTTLSNTYRKYRSIHNFNFDGGITTSSGSYNVGSATSFTVPSGVLMQVVVKTSGITVSGTGSGVQMVITGARDGTNTGTGTTVTLNPGQTAGIYSYMIYTTSTTISLQHVISGMSGHTCKATVSTMII